MNAIKEKTIQLNGYNLHFIPTKKFKTITLTAKLRAPLHSNTVTKRALLPSILRQATKNYTNQTEIQLKLDELYGAVLSVGGTKKGENHIITFRMEIANERYLPKGERFTEEAIGVFNELIFHPFLSDGLFSDKIFKREKNTLKQKIQAIKDNKIRYANMRLIDEMCKGEPYALHVNGYESELEEMTNEELFTYYKEMIVTDLLDIYIVGDFDQGLMETMMTDVFTQKRQGKTFGTSSFREKTIKSVNEIVEKEPIQQAKLHIGYRTNTFYGDEDYPALQVFNGLFGGFPSSKLFINVREKNSLAYYASSAVESHKGLLFVYSGIAPEDYEKARDIIREQMSEMKAGQFSEADLDETKEMMTHSLREAMDSNSGLVELFYQQQMAQTNLPLDTLVERIHAVTKTDVINAAKKIEEDTLYLLTTQGGE